MVDWSRYFPKCHGCGERIWLFFLAVKPPERHVALGGCWNHYDQKVNCWFHDRCARSIMAGWKDCLHERADPEEVREAFESAVSSMEDPTFFYAGYREE